MRPDEAGAETGEVGGAIRAPVEIAPPGTVVSATITRIPTTGAKGEIVRVCPPAPAAIAVIPSTSASAAFSVWHRPITT